MRRMPWTTCLWPGLPQLWIYGSWSGLVLALGMAVGLDLLVLASFGWSELIAPGLRSTLWTVFGLFWLTAAGWSARHCRRRAAAEEANPRRKRFHRGFGPLLERRLLPGGARPRRAVTAKPSRRGRPVDVGDVVAAHGPVRRSRADNSIRWCVWKRRQMAVGNSSARGICWRRRERNKPRPRSDGMLADRGNFAENIINVRAIYRPRPEGHATGQPRGPAVQSRIYRHRAHPLGSDQRGERGGGQRAEEPRRRSAQDPPRSREAGAERARHGDDGQAAADAPGQEGHRVLDGRGPQPQPQLRGHRTHPAGTAARAGRRGRPGVDEPRPEAGRGPRRGVEPAGPRHGRRGRVGAARRSARRSGERRGRRAPASRRRRPWTASAAT